MAIVSYNGVQYTIVFVDPSKSDSGDGTSVAQALNQLPATLADFTCYLIRRTNTDEAFVQHDASSSLTNIMLLGMPKASDLKWIQDLVTDTDANSQWKGDSASYANIRFWHDQSSSNTNGYQRACINANNLASLTIINAYCYRGEAATGSTNAQYKRNISPFFNNNFSTSNVVLNVLIENCKFGTKGVDLSNSASYSDKTSIVDFNEDTSTKEYGGYSRGYLNFQSGNSVVIRNCVVNQTPYDGSTTNASNSLNSAFVLNGFNSVTIRDCKLYQCLYSDATYDKSACFTVNDTNNVTFANIDSKNIVSANGLIRALSATPAKQTQTMLSRVSITNVNISFAKFGLDTVGKSTTNLRCGVFGEFGYITTSRINGIFADGTGEVKISQAVCLEVSTRRAVNGVPFSNEVNDIDIKLASDSAGGCYFNKINNAYCAILKNVYGVSIADEFAGKDNSETTVGSRGKTTDTPVYKNFSVSAPNCYLYIYGGTLNSANNFKCGLQARLGSSIDLASLDCSEFISESGIFINLGSYVRIRNLIASNSRRTVDLVNMNNYLSTCLYIDKSDVDLTDNQVYGSSNDTNYYNSQLCVANMVQTGRIFIRNRNTFAQSWGVSRTGSSSSACLKLNSNTASIYTPIKVGNEPFKGLTITPASTGNKILRIYFGYKGFITSDVTTGKKQFKIDVLVPRKDSNDNVYNDIYSSSEGLWSEDSSSWSDVDVKAMKIDIPINLTSTDPIEIKIEYGWFKTGSLVYLDPDIKIIDDSAYFA